MSKKLVRSPFSWKTLIHDFNADAIKSHDVLACREDFIKKLKKKCATMEEFAEALDRDFMHQYWARCEYEMIIYIENGIVYLEPWVGEFKEGRVDITDDTTLDWLAFAEKLLEHPWVDKETGRKYVKFDVYDQIRFRFDELIEFVWTYRHKYERRKKNEG